ncbi:MAG TPA: exodeoxyribonuclease V subunit alpha [Sedimenticola sp.]|nr:exodeoxyribonuclease V subunit alpha [Sedimenticola sp.]
MDELTILNRQGVLTELDVHFAHLMRRLSGGGSPELALGAALASNWTANGHICLDLAAEAGKRWRSGSGLVETPDLECWERALLKSPVVGRPGDYRPLVLDEAGRLYLYRYWEYEQEAAVALTRRAGHLVEAVDERRLRADLNKLFPKAPDGRADWQKLAAATAVLRHFSLISGGPGTGKTSTVIRILALLRQQPGGGELKIALAAPTGKAAARMQESIHQAKQGLPVDETVREAIPEQASTLHRLLGGSLDSVYFRHDANNPLLLDVLILDEASMVDLALMAKLMRALPERARLIMLGDRDQLASVEAGAVLADICGEAPGFSDAFHNRLTLLTGEEIPARNHAAPPLSDAIVLLRRSFRFGHESGIGRLASAVNQGRADACLALLENEQLPDIGVVPAQDAIAGRAAGVYRDYLERMGSGAPAERIFEAFNRFRVLCAVRGGPSGLGALNRGIEARLDGQGLIDAREACYAGRPIIITRNDHELHLYNGDMGILLPDRESDGRLRACFQTSEGVIRKIPPARLPEHETAFAMTVHKSQGSEFERVLLVLPEEDSPILSRELVYTGITRARRRFEISASPGVLAAAVARRLRRASGLRQALWETRD